MIDERSNLYLTGKLGNPSHMVAMKVGNQHIIDSLDAPCFGRGDDAAGVSPIKSRPTGIDKNCLPRGGNDQCCLPTFHIDEKDLKRLRFRGRYACAEKRACKRLQKETTEKGTHFGSLLTLVNTYSGSIGEQQAAKSPFSSRQSFVCAALSPEHPARAPWIHERPALVRPESHARSTALSLNQAPGSRK